MFEWIIQKTTSTRKSDFKHQNKYEWIKRETSINLY